MLAGGRARRGLLTQRHLDGPPQLKIGCAPGPPRAPQTPRKRSLISPQASAAQARVVPAEVAAESQDGDYFLDALLRSFLLGVGAGALVETTHVLFKFLGLAASSGPEIMGAPPLRACGPDRRR